MRELCILYKLRILFVDSDPIAHGRMQQVLGKDCVLHSVCSVTEAKEFLHISSSDMLISEVALLSESGLDLCLYVRNTPALYSLPIMLLTSSATLQDKVAGFQAGADDYVVKPFDARHLIARIRLLARIKRLEDRTSI
jgi:DNA-binding response OmpR family regulator